MRKLFALIAVLGMLTIGASTMLKAQEATDAAQEATQTTSTISSSDEDVVESTSLHAAIKQKFIEGGAGFMAAVILCLIFGLAIAIERVIYLNLSDTNTKKLVAGVEDALNNGGIEAAKEYCRCGRCVKQRRHRSSKRILPEFQRSCCQHFLSRFDAL